MAQYQNEYEGIGNALMGIGGMYYTASEKRKEEERKRKELEDERKYQEAQADKAYLRQAPLDVLKQKLTEARIASAEAEKTLKETQTYMPKTQMLGNVARTTMPVWDAEGNLSYESTDETMQPLNPAQPRAERSPYMRVGNDLVDTTTMQPVYKGKDKAAAEKPLYTSAQLMSARQQYNKMLADQAGNPSTTQRKAMQVAVDAQAQLIKDIESGLKAPLRKQESVPESTKQVAPFSDMVNAFIKKQGREPTATERVALRKKYDAWLAANKE